MIVGDQRRFVVALIVPNPTTVSAKLQDQGIRVASQEKMTTDPAVRSLIEGEVKRLTAHLAQWETIKRFALLPEDFTFDNGNLTSTLKLKRRVVEKNYREVIDNLYADSSIPVPTKSRS
jgi:long-chain acyl-CoA synthetase